MLLEGIKLLTELAAVITTRVLRLLSDPEINVRVFNQKTTAAVTSNAVQKEKH